MQITEAAYKFQVGRRFLGRIWWRNISRDAFINNVRRFHARGDDEDILAMLAPPARPENVRGPVLNSGRCLYRIIRKEIG